MIKLMISLLLVWLSVSLLFAQCSHNCKDGFGIMKYEDGAKYVGEWKYSQPNGIGIKTYGDGRKKEGIWRNGTFIHQKDVFDRIMDSLEITDTRTVPFDVPLEKSGFQQLPKATIGPLVEETSRPLLTWIAYQIKNNPIITIISFIIGIVGGLFSILRGPPKNKS